jgi:hypothetical protein
MDPQPPDAKTVERQMASALFQAFYVIQGRILEPNVRELLGYPGVEEWRKWKEIYPRSAPWFWFHLPVVCVDWVQDLISKLASRGIITDQTSASKFVKDNFPSSPCVTQAIPGTAEDSMVYAAMYFLSSDRIPTLNEDNNEPQKRLHHLYGVHKYEPGEGSVFISRPLDQCHALVNHLTPVLDRNQVMHRYYIRYKEGKLRSPGNTMKKPEDMKPRILMVSPFKLWKIGSRMPSNTSQKIAHDNLQMWSLQHGHKRDKRGSVTTLFREHKKLKPPGSSPTISLHCFPKGPTHRIIPGSMSIL